MALFKRQEALDLLQEKEARLAELTLRSETAVQMVRNTIDNLQVVNQDIEATVCEIDTYLQRLNETRANLDSTHGKNQKIMQNFSQLLCLD